MKPLLAPAARLVLAQLRKWDYAASKRVDRFIAISKNVQQRIARYYGRESDVVYPAIDLPRFHPTQNGNHTDGAFLVVGRLFSYKRVHVAVDACTRLRLPLKVIGRGPELKRLRDLAGPTVQFLGEVDDTTLEAEYRNCRALLFTSDEDFGLVPLEAMASGRPVLALNAGGARETVVPGQTGVLYEDAGTEPLVQELQRFRPADFDSRSCRARAEEFSVDRFHAGIRTVLERELGRAL
jgi:glycosyltransferase involved in cell wall biosynthesis